MIQTDNLDRVPAQMRVVAKYVLDTAQCTRSFPAQLADLLMRCADIVEREAAKHDATRQELDAMLIGLHREAALAQLPSKWITEVI